MKLSILSKEPVITLASIASISEIITDTANNAAAQGAVTVNWHVLATMCIALATRFLVWSKSSHNAEVDKAGADSKESALAFIRDEIQRALVEAGVVATTTVQTPTPPVA